MNKKRQALRWWILPLVLLVVGISCFAFIVLSPRGNVPYVSPILLDRTRFTFLHPAALEPVEAQYTFDAGRLYVVFAPPEQAHTKFRRWLGRYVPVGRLPRRTPVLTLSFIACISGEDRVFGRMMLTNPISTGSTATENELDAFASLAKNGHNFRIHYKTAAESAKTLREAETAREMVIESLRFLQPSEAVPTL